MNTGACDQYIITNHRSANIPELPRQQDLTGVNFLGVYSEVKSEIMSTKEVWGFFAESFYRNFRNLETTYVHTHARTHCKTTKLSRVNLSIFENAV